VSNLDLIDLHIKFIVSHQRETVKRMLLADFPLSQWTASYTTPTTLHSKIF